jgi:lysophospholipid acyltransferase (LPLAT)-like uncharacterized protein
MSQPKASETMATRNPAPQPARKSGPVIPHSPRWHQRALAWLLFALVQVVAVTIRFSFVDPHKVLDDGPPGSRIFCFWHNRLALCGYIYKSFLNKGNRALGVAALVSASKDGAFMIAVLERFGLHAARGSSSRRGPQALLELVSWAERGYDLALTPDGPRGPAFSVQQGVMSLAQLTGLPIVPITYNLEGKIQLGSWDGFLIPLPFCRCRIVLEKPVLVPREATDEQREEARAGLERTLRHISGL